MKCDPREMETVLKSFEGVPVIRMGNYSYFVHPLTDGIPTIDPELQKCVSRLMISLLPDGIEFDLISTAEAMGIPLSSCISEMMGVPYSIMRKRSYGVDGEVEAGQKTGYSSGRIYINVPKDARRTLIVDDVLSTGGTLKALVKGIRESGVEPAAALIFVDKMKPLERRELASVIKMDILSLVHVDIKGGKCMARPTADASRVMDQ